MSTTTNEQSFFLKKYTTSTAFLVGVLLFLLPFVEIRCNDRTVAQNTGIGLAIGSDFKSTNNLEQEFGLGDKASTENNDMEGKLYVGALAALILGIAGLIISFRNKGLGLVNIIIGVLAALSLMILLIHLKIDIRGKTDLENDATNPLSNGIRFTAEFTPWFYLSLVSFLAAAFFSFKKNQLTGTGDIVPKNAPQLNIDNPGDQSHFPKAASESDLG